MIQLRKHHVALLVITPFLIGAVASDSESDTHTRLSLTGVGFAEQPTEYVAVRAMTETFSTSPSDAVTDDAQKMRRLRDTLRRLGVEEEDFRTTQFQFAHGSRREDDERVEGFTVPHGLAITVRDVDNVGPALDALVDAGADGLSLDRSYGSRAEVNPTSLRRARAAAIRDAQAKASDYAAALNLRVRRIVSIADGSGYVTEGPMPA